jgi:polysaccharide biosynthesis transport protein
MVCLLVAAAVYLAGGGLLLLRKPVYQSTSSVALLPISTNSSVLPNYPNLISSLIPTYVQLVSSPVLLNRVAATLPFTISQTQLAADVHAESLSSAAVITIVAERPTAIQAQEIAAKTTAAFLAELQGNGVVSARIYGEPTVPGRPAGPRIKLVLGALLALAVIIGLAAGLAWDRLFGSADDAGQLADITLLPVLGTVPGAGRRPGAAAVLADRGPGAAQDSWRALRANFLRGTGHLPRSVTVTGLSPGDGKTTVAVNLAASLADVGLAVALVDAAVRRPAVHEELGMDNSQGLTSTVLSGADPASLLRPVPAIAGLRVVTAGPPLPGPRVEAGLYRKQLPRFTSLVDLVIVDGPCLQGDADATAVASATDGVVLVTPPGAARLEHLEAALRILRRSGTPVLGTVQADTSRIASTGEHGSKAAGAPGGKPGSEPGEDRRSHQAPGELSPAAGAQAQ